MSAVCRLIVCICPPQFAAETARLVLNQGFRGIYVDANGLSPRHTLQLAKQLAAADSHFVDGSVIGPPAWQQGTTEIYLSGAAAAEVAAYFAVGPLAARVVGSEIGMASALKMCDSAFNKSLLALLYETLAAADKLGVRESLLAAWERDPAGVGAVSTENNRVGRSARKAWRFVAEIDEVIDTLDALGHSVEFHRQARQVFERLAGFRLAQEVPDAASVIAALNVAAPSPPDKPGGAGGVDG
jgi:3-hydroxyisobutyrate dehydrogenase-like beta-hydroxyacid dehydrogenase